MCADPHGGKDSINGSNRPTRSEGSEIFYDSSRQLEIRYHYPLPISLVV